MALSLLRNLKKEWECEMNEDVDKIIPETTLFVTRKGRRRKLRFMIEFYPKFKIWIDESFSSAGFCLSAAEGEAIARVFYDEKERIFMGLDWFIESCHTHKEYRELSQKIKDDLIKYLETNGYFEEATNKINEYENGTR
jgi:hypothetical protein